MEIPKFQKIFECGKKFFLHFQPKSFPVLAIFDIFTAVQIKVTFWGFGSL